MELDVQMVHSQIKTLLHLRHNHNPPTWVALSDLVNAFDASNHTLLIVILGKYVAPPWLWLAIKRMYNKDLFKVVIGKKVDFKQGDSMVPLLFMFLMVAFFMTPEYNLAALGLIKAQFAHKENSPISTRHLVRHVPSTFLSGTLFGIFCMIYVDDGAFSFNPGSTLKEG